MSIMVNMPPQMAAEVHEYVAADDSQLSQLLMEYLKSEIAHRKAARQNPFEAARGCCKFPAGVHSTDELIREMRGC